MSFLSSTATIDAILTKKGRELLSAGNFNPSKFALSDDEIDYGLLSTEDGESKILNTMILEASSLGGDSNTQLKYKLIISDGQILIPQISVEPVSANMVVYDIFEVRLSTTDGGSDLSYTVVNNTSGLTLSPLKAISELQKQAYISSSGKNFTSIMNQLNILKSVYGDVKFNGQRPGRPSDYVYPESYVTKPSGPDNSHKFFLFAYSPISNLSKIDISGNNSGSVSNFTINKVRTTLQGSIGTL